MSLWRWVISHLKKKSSAESLTFELTIFRSVLMTSSWGHWPEYEMTQAAVVWIRHFRQIGANYHILKGSFWRRPSSCSCRLHLKFGSRNHEKIPKLKISKWPKAPAATQKIKSLTQKCTFRIGKIRDQIFFSISRKMRKHLSRVGVLVITGKLLRNGIILQLNMIANPEWNVLFFSLSIVCVLIL